jgi:hypothetical protein
MFDDSGHLPIYFFGQELGMKIFLQLLILFHCPFVKAFTALGVFMLKPANPIFLQNDRTPGSKLFKNVWAGTDSLVKIGCPSRNDGQSKKGCNGRKIDIPFIQDKTDRMFIDRLYNH